jgi:hypothetical protein
MKKRKDGIVKAGGVANEDAEIGDVTRDTYGFGEARSVKENPNERMSEADRAAGALGVPGVAVPAPPSSDRSEQEREEPGRSPARVEEVGREEKEDEFRRAEIAGDRMASPRDVAKLQREGRGQARAVETSMRGGRARRRRQSTDTK